MASPCPNATGCPLFPLFRMNASLGVWQVQYCDARFERCARYQAARAGTRVPPNLLPNGKTLNVPLAP